MSRISPPNRTPPPTRSRRPPQRPSLKRGASATPVWQRLAVIGGGVGVLLVIVVLTIQALTARESLPSPTAEPTTALPSSSVVPSTAPQPTSITGIVAGTALPPDIPTLQQLMLTLINDDRRANGLSTLAWDNIAATAGLQHAQEMASFNYLSHWNLDGYGPDYRYSLAGGLDNIRENAYMYQHSGPNSAPATSQDWEQRIREAQKSLMNSPGHRDNILAREHTHVGIGIAYEATTGQLRITQEFVDRYITLQPFVRRVALGGQINIVGQLRVGASNPLLNLAYEPLPAPKSIAELSTTNTYTSPAENYSSSPLTTDGEGRFSQVLTLDNNSQPGLYHVRIWVDTAAGQVMAADVVVEVQ